MILTNSKSTWMSKSAQNCRHLQAETPCTAPWRLVLLQRCNCPVSPHWYLPPLSSSHEWTRAWPFKLGVWPTPIRKSCKDCNQGNAEAKRLPTGTKWFFLLRASSGWFRISEQLHHHVARHWLDWWVTDELLPARLDLEQIKGIGDINADLPASSTIHFTIRPFPSMSQTNSCHDRAFPLSQISLFIFGILCHPGNFIFLILGLGEEDTISHDSQKAAQGVSACKW